MIDAHQAETVAVKACCACGMGMLECDKFCRLCGVRQSGSLQTNNENITSRLEGVRVEADFCRPVSGPLVKAVVAGVSANTTDNLQSNVVSKAILWLVFIPIWIIIVLLSPLDALAAAKSVSRSSNVEVRPGRAREAFCPVFK